jgi:outer membrane protein TolC
MFLAQNRINPVRSSMKGIASIMRASLLFHEYCEGAMKRIIHFIAIAALSYPLTAGYLSLYECYDKAEKTHPLQREYRNRQTVYDLNLRNLNARWLPSLEANAGATYLSDVARIDRILGSLPVQIPMESLPAMPHDQYKVTVGFNQTVYDGGAINAGKKVEKAALNADLLALDSEIYKIRDQVNQAYFGLLNLQKQSELAAIYYDEILERRSALSSRVKNGFVLPANLDILDAELLKIRQQIAELDIQQTKARNILGRLIDENAEDTAVSLPDVQTPVESRIRRPEIEWFEQQRTALEMNKKVIQSQCQPRAFIFGTYGYGQPPGSDFFTEQFEPYYIVGVAASWEFFNWNTTRRNRGILQARQNMIEAKEENFIKQIQIALQNCQAEIDRYRVLQESDKKLILLREKIKLSAASQLNNGTLSSTEFLTELNAEREARINYELHIIQWIQAQVNYLTVSGQIENEE